MELLARWDLVKLVAWVIIVLLFASFVFSIANVQLGVKFSDEAVTKDKRDRISSEVFGNLVYHVIFIGLILVLGIIGYIYARGIGVERSVTSTPGEVIS